MKTYVKMVACLVFLISLLAVSCNPAGNSTALVQEPPDPGPGDDGNFHFEIEYEDDHGGGIENPDNWKVTGADPYTGEIPPDHLEMNQIRIISFNPTCIQIGNRLWCH